MNTTQDWIPVSERLPKESPVFPKRYLAARNSIVLEVKFSGGKWYSVTDSRELDPTHWMPLPEPPTKPDAFTDWYSSRDNWCGFTTEAIARFAWDAALASVSRPAKEFLELAEFVAYKMPEDFQDHATAKLMAQKALASVGKNR